MAIHRTLEFRVQAGEVESCKAAIEKDVATVGGESGTVYYYAMQDEADPQRFLHVVGFDDEAAREAHGNTEHAARFVERITPALESAIEVRSWSVAAATHRE